jgi:two-component system, sensor histidine kinase
MSFDEKFKSKSILVAEDDEDTRCMMQDILEAMGCVFEFAFDGLHALELFKTKKYDMILMDVRMPKMDGITTITEIRKLEKGDEHTPIVALTASIQELRAGPTIEGADGFLEKPINIDNLSELMSKLMK